MKRTIVDIHALQTVPPSNMNRDDTGSPKTALYGGIRRARVSSQAWKHAIRQQFAERFDASDLGTRTKRIVELIAAEIEQLASEIEDAPALASEVVKASGMKVAKAKNRDADETDYLFFVSTRQVRALAKEAVRAHAAGGASQIDKKAVKSILMSDNSVDISLFGRMVADVNDLNVDAAAQVAHALSVHGVENEYDYFTAVDDEKNRSENEDAGAGMIGTVEFNSSTLYRYATLNVDALVPQLGDGRVTSRAVREFVDAFLTSMPTGKQNTFANRTLPDAVIISVRADRPMSYVGAFETPIVATSNEGVSAQATRALVDYARDVNAAFDGDAIASWTIGVGGAKAHLSSVRAPVSLKESLSELERVIDERLRSE